MSAGKKNLVLGVGAVVILAAAGVVLLTRGGGPQAKYPTGYVVQGVDLETKADVTIHASNKETAPFVNPATGKRTVYPWFFCEECKWRFVPALEPSRTGGPPKLPMIPACPKCGKPGTPWSPDFPEQAEPAGDAPLPALPS
jgi:hypothetical protein